ncbi:MAG: DMT family transporter, partial [Lachnospiraceae bacterium]
MIGIFIALLSGALMSIQGVFNTAVAKSTSIWVSNSWVQFSALIICVAAWLTTDRKSFGELLQVEPKYMLLGGVLGAMITFTVVKSMAALGPAQGVMIIVISQLVVAYLIELCGAFGVTQEPFQWRRVIGMAVCIGGIILFKWKS